MIKTLEGFLAGGGIDEHEFIILLNHGDPFNRCVKLIRKDRLYSKLIKKRILRDVLRKCNIFEDLHVPSKDAVIYLGYEDKSLDRRDFILKQAFESLRRKEDCCFILVLGKGDYHVDDELRAALPENVSVLFGNNVMEDSKRFRFLPMGRDFRSIEEIHSTKVRLDKSILAYCNFSVTTFPPRQRIYEGLKGKSYITFDHMGRFKHYSITRAEFYEKLAASKFSFCPRGNALDTFRFWDCLYLGTVPIVVREGRFYDRFQDLPILVVDHIEDLFKLEPDYLESVHAAYLKREWDFKQLKLSHWMRNIWDCWESVCNPQQEVEETH